MNIRTVTFEEFTFVDVHDPQEFETKFLKQNYHFQPLHLEDFINKQTIVKIEEEDEYILINLDFPYIENPESEKNNKKEDKTKSEEHKKGALPAIPNPVNIPSLLLSQPKKKRIRTGHLTFFIGDKYLVVLHDERTPQIDEIFTECQKTLKKREELLGLGPQYLFYRIIDILVDSSLSVAQDIYATIDKIDQHIVDNKPAEKIVEDISATRRNIVVFETMVKPALTLFSDLENGKHPRLNHTLTSSWSNIRDHLQRIWYRLDDSKELIEGLASSHESLLTAKTNEIVKVLTMFTAILLPLTLLASIYGMNIVGLPYAQQQNALLVVSGAMVVLALGMLLLFKLRNWL